MRKNHTAAILTALLLLTAQAAQADGLGVTSQFGFAGWPGINRNHVSVSPTHGAAEGSKQESSTTYPGVFATAAPQAPTSNPLARTPSPIRPTPAPTAVIRPTAVPTRAPAATRTSSTGDDYTTVSISAQEQNALNLLNSDRQAKNLPALPLDLELCRLARLKCEDMRDRHYFAHESPTYGKAADMLKRFGYSFGAVGENIAHHATVEKAEAAFLSSDAHRRNLLAKSWSKVGVGVCYDANGYVYVTQLFVR